MMNDNTGVTNSNNINNIYINNKLNNIEQYINIGTHNVKGFNQINKRNCFFTFYENEINLDIIGLTETKLKQSDDKYMSKPNKIDDKVYLKNYQTWWTGSNIHFMSSGVGIAIKKEIARHVIKIEKIEGRAIKICLQFKGKINLMIITI